MTIYVPGWLQGGSFSAKQDRINGRAQDWDEGVMDRASFKVTQRGAGANMTVDVAAGSAIVQGDDQAFQGNYTAFSDAVASVAGFVVTSSNTRYDLVGIQINDPDAGGAAGSNATIVRVAGTQGASPAIPAIPNSFLTLAIVGPFTTSTATITNAMIHDVWTGTGPTGVTGVRLCAGFRDTPGTTKETYNAIAPNGWLIEAGQSLATASYPRLFEHFGYTFGGAGANFSLPDSRGRVFAALDDQGGSDAGRVSASNAVGETGGSNEPSAAAINIALKDASTESAMTIAKISGVSGQINVTHVMAWGDSNEATARNLTIPAQGALASDRNLQPTIFGYRIVRT